MSQSISKIILWSWRLVLFFWVLIFSLWLLWQNLVPSGYLKLNQDFCKPTVFISNLYPENRVGDLEIDEQGRCFQRFFDEPVYFKLKIPRSFEGARLKIYYQNENQPLFQVGLMKLKQNSTDWQFQLKPIENQIFDNLTWPKLTFTGLTLWQKEKRFETIQEFVNNLPANQKVATFYYKLAPEAIKNQNNVIVWNQKTSLQDVDYIIAKYQTPKIFGDLKVTEIDFLITPEFSDGRRIEFMFSAPEMIRNQTQIKIYRIEAELTREPLTWENFKITIKNFINQIKEKL